MRYCIEMIPGNAVCPAAEKGEALRGKLRKRKSYDLYGEEWPGLVDRRGPGRGTLGQRAGSGGPLQNYARMICL